MFTDARGTAYLLWKSDDNALGQRTSLWSRPLASDSAGFARSSVPVRLLTQTAPWQAPAVEGPSMVETSKAFYLFYGAGDWDSSSSAIGYATCATPLGPCTDRSTVGPCSLKDVVHFEVACAQGHGLGDPLGHDADFQPTQVGQRNSSAVMRMEAFGLNHVLADDAISGRIGMLLGMKCDATPR